jgi:outer membrane lipoprotein-sorting protein
MKRLFVILLLVTVSACAQMATGAAVKLTSTACANRTFTLAEMRQAFEEGVGFGLSEPVRETDEAFKRLVLRGKCQ